MKAYIFDLDGTLLDSMGIWDKIDIDFLAKRGIDVPPDYGDALSPLSFTEVAKYTIKRFNLPDSVEDLLREWNEMAIYAYGNTIELKPYAKEYLTKLNEFKKCGVKIAIATTCPPELYTPALQKHGILEYFDVICTTSEVANGKTKPDIYILTAQKLGVSLCDCIVFEDILPAVKSAKQIGMTVYGIYDSASKKVWEEIKNIADGVIYDFKGAPLM